MSGILTISAAHNTFFSTLLNWYGYNCGNDYPEWGYCSQLFSYYTVKGFQEQVDLYLTHKIIQNPYCWGDVADRTQKLRLPFKWHVRQPWAVPTQTNLSYTDVVNKRVQDLVSKGKHIYILYSGGIDSSTIVSAFIANNVPKWDYTVCYTKESIDEYLYFFEYMQKNDIPLFDITDTQLSTLDGIILSGDGNDSIHGVVRPDQIGLLQKSGTEYVLKHNSALMDFIEKYQSLSGFDGDSLIHLKLFHALNSTLQSKDTTTLHFDPELSVDQCHSFFIYEDFYNWAYTNIDSLIISDYKFYKAKSKEYIYSLLKDQHYFDTKTKVPSRWFYFNRMLNANGTSANRYYFIDHTGERIGLVNTKEEFFRKYRNRFDNYFI